MSLGKHDQIPKVQLRNFKVTEKGDPLGPNFRVRLIDTDEDLPHHFVVGHYISF